MTASPQPRDSDSGENRSMDSLSAFRAYLEERHGMTYGATDEQLKALLDRAHAKREALGYGSVFVMAAGWLREAYSA